MRNPHIKKEISPYKDVTIQYKKQLFWQVIFPISCGAFVFLLIAVLLSVPEINNYEAVYKWAIVSLLFLLIPTIVFGLVILVLLLLGIFGLSKANSGLPGFMRQIYDYLLVFRLMLTRGLDKTVSPILAINGWIAMAGSLKKITFRSFRR